MHMLLFALLIVSPDTLNLTLDQALRIGLRQSTVQAEVKASKTQSVSTLARGITALLPSVSGSVGYGKSNGFGLPESLRAGPDWSWTGNLTINQVVFDPAVFTGLASSIVYSQYYSTDARNRQAKLVYDITTDYLNLLKAQLLRDAARAALCRADENLKVIREKHRLGSASEIDLMRFEVFKSQAEIELLKAEKSLAVAAVVFKATVNLNGEVAVQPTEELTQPAGFRVSDPDSLLAEIKRRNPGLAMAAKSNTIARINLASSVSQALPSVSAYWASNYSDSCFPSVSHQWNDNDAVSYGIRATFPLLNLKSYILNIVDRASESRRAGAASMSAALTIRSTALSAILGYEEAKKTCGYARRNLKLNRRLHELAKEQLRLGAISLADLFGVEADLAQAQATDTRALCDSYIQAAQINYLLGMARAPAKEAQ